MEDFRFLIARLEKITNEINKISITLTAQHITLKEHMRRTDLLEKAVNIMEKRELKRSAVVKITGFLVGVLAAAATIAELFGFIKKG